MTVGPSNNELPDRKELHRLFDTLEAINNIQGHPSFKGGRAAWFEDKYYRGYCERQLLIIGEAASYLTNKCSYDTKYPETPWRQIKALRNLLSHEYWSSDPHILWGIIDKHLPAIKLQVSTMISDLEKLAVTPDTQDAAPKESKLKRKLRELTDEDKSSS